MRCVQQNSYALALLKAIFKVYLYTFYDLIIDCWNICSFLILPCPRPMVFAFYFHACIIAAMTREVSWRNLSFIILIQLRVAPIFCWIVTELKLTLNLKTFLSLWDNQFWFSVENFGSVVIISLYFADF